MAKKTKILYLVTQSEWGGAQRYVFDLATNLDPNEYEVAVAAGGDDELFAKLGTKNIKCHRLKNLVRQVNPGKDIRAYREIKNLIQDIRPDILHLNSSKISILGALAGKSAKVPKIIYTVHGFVFNEPLPFWQKKMYRCLEKFTARFKDKLICVSESDAKTGLAKKIAPADKLITIHNGIKPIEFLSIDQARQELNLPPHKTVVGTIANFYPTKGLSNLIKAAALTIKKHPEIIFRLIGFGRLEDELKAEIKKLKLENNFFLGRKENAARFLKAFDIFILPSVKEGLPYTILEAMQAGLPIIATKVGGVPEMINHGQNGLLVAPINPSQLATALNELLENKKEAEELAKQAKMDFEKNFSLEQMIRQTTAVYQN